MRHLDRPLRQDTVTQGTQVILPAYPIMFLMVAGLLLLQDPQRTAGAAWDIPRMLMPVQWWGFVFFAVGAGEVLALVWAKRRMIVRLLILGAGISAFWAVLLLASAYDSKDVSWTSGVWVSLAPVAHIASIRSLVRDDVRRP